MRAEYHYEYAAYTDNLCYGKELIAQDRSLYWVRLCTANSDKGAYVIKKVRVIN